MLRVVADIKANNATEIKDPIFITQIYLVLAFLVAIATKSEDARN